MSIEVLAGKYPSKLISIFNVKRKPKPSIVFNTYWKFAAERQEIFFRRTEKIIPPWTSDIILKRFKFTNAYRATDRVSQYLIREVIYNGNQNPKEVLFRILLFKLFNKIETWQLITKMVGKICIDSYNYNEFDRILGDAKGRGESIYSGAYIMASGREAFGYNFKHQNHLKLIELMLKERLCDKIQSCQSMVELYFALKEYATIGSFLAYQLATDINYSNLTSFSEMDFVKAGPGARDGIKKCFLDYGDYSEEDIIRMMADGQQKEFERLDINFRSLWGRPLQLVDCQNLFCEVDKYSRVAHPEIIGISNRKRIKQKFITTSYTPIDFYFPPKWNLIVNKE